MFLSLFTLATYTKKMPVFRGRKVDSKVDFEYRFYELKLPDSRTFRGFKWAVATQEKYQKSNLSASKDDEKSISETKK